MCVPVDHKFPVLTLQENTFQAIAITNGMQSYAVYTYQCDLMEWPGTATIGYNGGPNFFENHPYSGRPDAQRVACVYLPDSNWSNLVYNITASDVTISIPQPTYEPRK